MISLKKQNISGHQHKADIVLPVEAATITIKLANDSIELFTFYEPNYAYVLRFLGKIKILSLLKHQ
jgi:hypothetical protein